MARGPGPAGGRPVTEWGKADVALWLESIGLGAYHEYFASLCGRSLLALKSDEQLRTLLALPIPLPVPLAGADGDGERSTGAQTAGWHVKHHISRCQGPLVYQKESGEGEWSEFGANALHVCVDELPRLLRRVALLGREEAAVDAVLATLRDEVDARPLRHHRASQGR